MKSYKIFLLLFVFCVYSFSLLANPLGTLYLEKGKVVIHRNLIDSVYHESGATIPVFNRDEIQTGVNTRVKIRLSAKKDEIELYSLTLFKLDDVTAEKNNVSIFTGKARFLIQKKQKLRKRRFRIRTANALVGVKGTEFIVDCGDGITSVLALSGIVTLSNISELDITVDLRINHTSQVNQTARPTIPVVVPAAIRQSIISRDGAEGFKKIKFGEVISRLQLEKKDKEAQKNQSPTEKPADAINNDAQTEDTDIEEELDTIEDAISEVTEEAEEQPSTLQTIDIKVVN